MQHDKAFLSFCFISSKTILIKADGLMAMLLTFVARNVVNARAIRFQSRLIDDRAEKKQRERRMAKKIFAHVSEFLPPQSDRKEHR